MTLILDGSQGEGGGQIPRSALSLSMCTGTPFRIERIRAGRKKPSLHTITNAGVMQQFLPVAIDIRKHDAGCFEIGVRCR